MWPGREKRLKGEAVSCPCLNSHWDTCSAHAHVQGLASSSCGLWQRGSLRVLQWCLGVIQRVRAWRHGFITWPSVYPSSSRFRKSRDETHHTFCGTELQFQRGTSPVPKQLLPHTDSHLLLSRSLFSLLPFFLLRGVEREVQTYS